MPPCHPAIILQPVGQSLYLELVVSDFCQIQSNSYRCAIDSPKNCHAIAQNYANFLRDVALDFDLAIDVCYVCYSERGIEGLVLQSFSHSTLREPGTLRFWPRTGPEKAAQAEQAALQGPSSASSLWRWCALYSYVLRLPHLPAQEPMGHQL